MPTNTAESRPLDGDALHNRKPGDGDCWNHIGVSGDRTCSELSSFIHCRNCPVFATAARSFFERPAPEGYLASWSRWLANSVEQDGDDEGGREDENEARSHQEKVSVLIFRLGPEWLAFRTQTVAEVTTPRPVHRVPHRTNEVFLGLVNLQGQVQLCVSLHGLVGAASPESSGRLIVLRDRDRAET